MGKQVVTTTRSGVELHSVPSTQQLVSAQSNLLVFSKGRKRLEVCLLFLCVLLLIACVVLAVLLALELTERGDETRIAAPKKNSTTNVPEDECTSAECLAISAFFAKNLNESVDPCHDFFHFSCDGWIRDNPIPPSKNEYVTFLKKIYENRQKLRNLLEDFTGAFDDPVSKAKRYYKSCMNEEEVERTTTQQMLELIRSLGSWSMDKQAWNETSWNWTVALQAIQSSFARQSPLFKINVVVDPKDSLKHIIMVSMAGFFISPTLTDKTFVNFHVRLHANSSLSGWGLFENRINSHRPRAGFEGGGNYETCDLTTRLCSIELYGPSFLNTYILYTDQHCGFAAVRFPLALYC